jgi:hypothetical protein
VRHRAADLGPVFDAAGYGGGLDLESADTTRRGGFEPVAVPEPPPLPRRGHPLAVAGTAAVALVGAALLVAGATQVVQRNELTGLATPQPGPVPIAHHQAPGPGVLHQPLVTVPASPAPPPSSSASPPPGPPAPAGSGSAAAGTQLPNTIRLPRGGTAYLVHVEVADDGSLPIPSGVDQAVWWGTGLDAAAGATVFAGHVNWAGVTGPFAELWQDSVGAVVTVRDNSGKQLRYRVTQVLTLNKSQLPQQAPTLFAPTGPQRIVVATCGGEWVGGSLGYADNRVLVAMPVHG